MASLDDVAALALTLPEVTEGKRRETRTWSVSGKVFAWERPLTKADIKRYGDETPPDGPIVAIKVADMSEKEAVLAEQRRGFFNMQHFDNYPAVLIQLKAARKTDLKRALIDGWLAVAPPSLANEHVSKLVSR